MNDQTDAQLLRAYVGARSEAAFAELVRRHLDFVYSAARRMVCDPHLAEDVTQGVFVALAKNSAQLHERPILSGWLHRTAQNIAAQTVRTIERRRAREQEAAAMTELLSAEADTSWENIAPHLDAALGELAEVDRDALLLRYFERKSASEMAKLLGISDEAAQKRVSRAVERLREFLARRGVTVGAGGLVVLISTNAVLIAPTGLSAAIVTAAAGISVATVGTTAIIAMSWINAKSAAAIFAAAILAGTGTYLAQEQRLARAEAHQHELANQQAQLTASLDTANAAAGARAAELEKQRKDAADLARLRNEVTQLRQQIATAATRTQKESSPAKALPQVVAAVEPGKYISTNQLAFAGYDTPEAALQSALWAGLSGNFDIFTNSFQRRMGDDEFDRADFMNDLKNEPGPIGIQILARKTPREGWVELKVKIDMGAAAEPGIAGVEITTLARENGAWKIIRDVHPEVKEWEKTGDILTYAP